MPGALLPSTLAHPEAELSVPKAACEGAAPPTQVRLEPLVLSHRGGDQGLEPCRAGLSWHKCPGGEAQLEGSVSQWTPVLIPAHLSRKGLAQTWYREEPTVSLWEASSACLQHTRHQTRASGGDQTAGAPAQTHLSM